MFAGELIRTLLLLFEREDTQPPPDFTCRLALSAGVAVQWGPRELRADAESRLGLAPGGVRGAGRMGSTGWTQEADFLTGMGSYLGTAFWCVCTCRTAGAALCRYVHIPCRAAKGV